LKAVSLYLSLPRRFGAAHHALLLEGVGSAARALWAGAHARRRALLRAVRSMHLAGWRAQALKAAAPIATINSTGRAVRMLGAWARQRRRAAIAAVAQLAYRARAALVGWRLSARLARAATGLAGQSGRVQQRHALRKLARCAALAVGEAVRRAAMQGYRVRLALRWLRARAQAADPARAISQRRSMQLAVQNARAVVEKRHLARVLRTLALPARSAAARARGAENVWAAAFRAFRLHVGRRATRTAARRALHAASEHLRTRRLRAATSAWALAALAAATAAAANAAIRQCERERAVTQAVAEAAPSRIAAEAEHAAEAKRRAGAADAREKQRRWALHLIPARVPTSTRPSARDVGQQTRSELLQPDRSGEEAALDPRASHAESPSLYGVTLRRVRLPPAAWQLPPLAPASASAAMRPAGERGWERELLRPRQSALRGAQRGASHPAASPQRLAEGAAAGTQQAFASELGTEAFESRGVALSCWAASAARELQVGALLEVHRERRALAQLDAAFYVLHALDRGSSHWLRSLARAVAGQALGRLRLFARGRRARTRQLRASNRHAEGAPARQLLAAFSLLAVSQLARGARGGDVARIAHVTALATRRLSAQARLRSALRAWARG